MALAAAKGDRTTAKLASYFGIHTSQVTAWRKQLMAQVAELLADGRQRRIEQATDEEELYEQIGRLRMEVEWFKKLPRSAEVMRRCIDPNLKQLSLSRQCQVVGLPRSSCYYQPAGESAEIPAGYGRSTACPSSRRSSARARSRSTSASTASERSGSCG